MFSTSCGHSSLFVAFSLRMLVVFSLFLSPGRVEDGKIFSKLHEKNKIEAKRSGAPLERGLSLGEAAVVIASAVVGAVVGHRSCAFLARSLSRRREEGVGSQARVRVCVGREGARARVRFLFLFLQQRRRSIDDDFFTRESSKNGRELSLSQLSCFFGIVELERRRLHRLLPPFPIPSPSRPPIQPPPPWLRL